MNETEEPRHEQEGAMEGAMDREMAAETLRTVRGMQAKTMAAARRPSSLEPLVFGVAALIAAPFGLLASDIWLSIALGVALVSAIGITDLHYQRLPVHPAIPEPRARSSAEVILLALLIIVVAPQLIALIFVLPNTGPVFMTLVLFTLTSVFFGKRFHNTALTYAGEISLGALAAGPFTWADHWGFVVAAIYGAVFLTAALVARIVGRRAA